ncbi:hypothetical protein [Microtetraspora fusca]|nr:hypothetical protein [Microtetraspora fusca]
MKVRDLREAGASERRRHAVAALRKATNQAVEYAGRALRPR